MLGNPLRRPLQRAVAATAAALLLTNGASAAEAPGEGVICAVAMYTHISEVMSRCHPGRSPGHEAEVRRSVTRLDQYMLQNSEMSPDELARFKQEQAGVGLPTEQLCKSGETVYEAVTEKTVGELRGIVDALVARPGRPTWGTCV